jgi:hypothetical protein
MRKTLNGDLSNEEMNVVMEQERGRRERAAETRERIFKNTGTQEHRQ